VGSVPFAFPDCLIEVIMLSGEIVIPVILEVKNMLILKR
jgi:hypothetical protein